jgi:hypothetical protein
MRDALVQEINSVVELLTSDVIEFEAQQIWWKPRENIENLRAWVWDGRFQVDVKVQFTKMLEIQESTENRRRVDILPTGPFEDFQIWRVLL